MKSCQVAVDNLPKGFEIRIWLLCVGSLTPHGHDRWCSSVSGGCDLNAESTYNGGSATPTFYTKGHVQVNSALDFL